MQEVIGDKGRRDLEHALHVCGVKPGFERGFAGLLLEKAVSDLSTLTEDEEAFVREGARWLAEYESQARQKEADDREIPSNAEMISEGAKWLGLSTTL